MQIWLESLWSFFFFSFLPVQFRKAGSFVVLVIIACFPLLAWQVCFWAPVICLECPSSLPVTKMQLTRVKLHPDTHISSQARRWCTTGDGRSRSESAQSPLFMPELNYLSSKTSTWNNWMIWEQPRAEKSFTKRRSWSELSCKGQVEQTVQPYLGRY